MPKFSTAEFQELHDTNIKLLLAMKLMSVISHAAYIQDVCILCLPVIHELVLHTSVGKSDKFYNKHIHGFIVDLYIGNPNIVNNCKEE